MAGLGTLRQLDLDHLHLWVGGVGREALLTETTVVGAATEVARADLPHQVATVLAVVRRNRAFPGVVIEATQLRALVQCADGVGRQRAEAHRRNVEHAGRVRLRGPLADGDAEVVGVVRRRRHGVVDPLVVHAVHVLQRAEWTGVVDRLGTLVDQRPLLPRKRGFGGVGLDEVLPHFRADRLQSVTEMRQQRIHPSQRAARLDQIPRAQRS